MAEEIAYNVSVNTGEGGKSLKSLKKDFKDAQQELDGLTVGTAAYVKQLEKLGGIRDDIGDLNQQINAFNPEGKVKAFGNVVSGLASGFQAASGAAALFGADSKEVEKALLKVQAVMAFTEGIKGITALGDSFQVLTSIIKANPIVAFATALAALASTAFVLYTNFNMTSQATKNLTKELERQHEVTEALSRESKRQIELLTAQGGSEREIIAIKEKLIQTQIMELETSLKVHQRKIEDVKDNDSLWESTLKLAGAIQSKLGNTQMAEAYDKAIQINKKERAQEDLDAIAKEKEDLLDLQTNIKILSAEKIKLDKKETQEYKIELDKRKADRKAHNDYIKQIDAEVAAAKLEDEQNQKEAEDTTAANQIANNTKAMEAANALYEYKKNKAKELAAEEAAIQKATNEESLKTAAASTNAIASLSNFLFDLKRNHLEKGSDAELKSAKRQFNVNKALAVSSNIISTILGVTNALSARSTIPDPIGTVLRIANASAVGISGGVATAKIAAQKFEGSGSGGGGSSSVTLPSPPTIAPPSQGSTLLNPDGTVKGDSNNKQPVIKAVVVETDITRSQKAINTIENASKF